MAWLYRSIVATVFVAALSLVFFNNANASSSPEPLMAGVGTVTGTVTDADGKPASGCVVKLTQPNTTGGAIGPKGGGPDATFRPEPNPLMPTKGDKVIKQGTTDGSGKFSITNVPEGPYTCVAEMGKLSVKATVVVEKGKTRDVELKLPKK